MSQIEIPGEAKVKRVLQVRLDAVVHVDDDRSLGLAVAQALGAVIDGEAVLTPGEWATIEVTHDPQEKDPDGTRHAIRVPPVQTAVRVRQTFRNDYFVNGERQDVGDFATPIDCVGDIPPAEVQVPC